MPLKQMQFQKEVIREEYNDLNVLKQISYETDKSLQQRKNIKISNKKEGK